jgi:hypothetical protein
MRTQPADRRPMPEMAARRSSIVGTAVPVGRFLAELGGMCAVMCAGGMILSLAFFGAAAGLGFPNLAGQTPEVSVLIIAVCLSLPMAAYMAVRRHPLRHNVAMTGSTIGVGLLVAGLLWSGAIAANGMHGMHGWHGLFGMVCGPACLVMGVEMLISFNMYSGRARRRGPTA